MTKRLAKKVLRYSWPQSARLSDHRIEAAARRLARGCSHDGRVRLGEQVIRMKASARLMRGDLDGFRAVYVTPRWLRRLEDGP